MDGKIFTLDPQSYCNTYVVCLTQKEPPYKACLESYETPCVYIDY